MYFNDPFESQRIWHTDHCHDGENNFDPQQVLVFFVHDESPLIPNAHLASDGYLLNRNELLATRTA
jgi:hypothetical protein